MVCKPCKDQQHGECPVLRDYDPITGTVTVEPTWCDCQHIRTENAPLRIHS